MVIQPTIQYLQWTVNDNYSLMNTISKQLALINNTLSDISKALSTQSFWNSQLFAAIIGASSAILVLLIQQFWVWYRNKKHKFNEVCNWIAGKYQFMTPDVLFEIASSTSYGSTVHNKTTREEKIIPEKPLGDKMVIELRSKVKYWRFPSFRLRRLFKKYEMSLNKFNDFDSIDGDDLNRLLSESRKYIEIIKNIAFRKTGENDYTI